MSIQPNEMKQRNLRILRQILLTHGTLTKPQLAKLSALSTVTVNALMKELLDQQEVVELERIPSNGGRPAMQYRYRHDERLSLNIILYARDGKEYLYMEIMDVFRKPLSSCTLPLAELTLADVKEWIMKYVTTIPAIAAIIFSIPGITHEHQLIQMDYSLLDVPDFFEELSLASQLPVYIENDVHTALYAQPDTVQSVAAFYLPLHYPPGSALRTQGITIQGAHGMAGELSYLPYGIDWARPYANQEEKIELFVKMAQSLIAMYDPDRLILYSGELQAEELAQIKERLQERIPCRLPQIEQKASMEEDMEEGIRKQAQQILWNQITGGEHI